MPLSERIGIDSSISRKKKQDDDWLISVVPSIIAGRDGPSPDLSGEFLTHCVLPYTLCCTEQWMVEHIMKSHVAFSSNAKRHLKSSSLPQ